MFWKFSSPPPPRCIPFSIPSDSQVRYKKVRDLRKVNNFNAFREKDRYVSLSSLQLRRSGIHKWPNKAKLYIKSLGISFPVQKNASRLQIVFVVTTHQDSCQKQATPAKDIYNVFMDVWIPDNQSGLGGVTIMTRYWQWRKNRRDAQMMSNETYSMYKIFPL